MSSGPYSSKSYSYDSASISVESLYSFLNNSVKGPFFNTNPTLEKVVNIFLERLVEEKELDCEFSLIERAVANRISSLKPFFREAREIRPLGEMDLSLCVKTENQRETILKIETLLRESLKEFLGVSCSSKVFSADHMVGECYLTPFSGRDVSLQFSIHAIKDWSVLVHPSQNVLLIGSFRKILESTNFREYTIWPKPTHQFPLEKVLRVFLSRLAQEEDLDCDVTLGGSAALSIALYRENLRSKPYGDIDISVCVKDENPSEAIVRVERILKEFLSIRPIKLNVIDSDHVFGVCRLENGLPTDVPTEISIHGIRHWQVPTHLSLRTSVKIPLKLFGQIIGSTAPYEYQIYSEEGPYNQVIRSIFQRRTSSSVAHLCFGSACFRILKEVLEGDSHLPFENNQTFFANLRKFPGLVLDQMQNYIENKKLERVAIYYKLNAYIHSVFAKEDCLLVPLLRESFKKEVQQVSENIQQKSWICSLQEIITQCSDFELLAVLKKVIPYFSPRVCLKMHLGEAQLQCEFRLAEQFVMIPFSNEREDQIFQEVSSRCNWAQINDGFALKANSAKIDFLFTLQSLPLNEWTEQELNAALKKCDIRAFSLQAKQGLAQTIPLIFQWILMKSIRDCEFFTSFLELIENLSPFVQEVNPIVYFIFQTYKGNLNQISPSLWNQLFKFVSSHKELYVFLVLNLPDKPSQEMILFLKNSQQFLDLNDLESIPATQKGILSYCLRTVHLENPEISREENKESLIKIAYKRFQYNAKVKAALQEEPIDEESLLFCIYHHIQEKNPKKAISLIYFLQERKQIVQQIFCLFQECKEEKECMSLAILEIERNLLAYWDEILKKDASLILTVLEEYPAVFPQVRSSFFRVLTDSLENFILKEPEKIEEIAKALLLGASKEDLLYFAQKCVELFPLENSELLKKLFVLSVCPLDNFEERLQSSFESQESLKKWFFLLVETKQISEKKIEILLSKVKDYALLESQVLISQMLFCLEGKEVFFERNSQALLPEEEEVLGRNNVRLLSLLLKSKESLPSFFMLQAQLIGSLRSLKEKTQYSYGVISFLLKAYEGRVNEISPALWGELENCLVVGQGPILKRWKALFISLLCSFSTFSSRSFLLKLSNFTESLPFSEHQEMFQTGESALSYFQGLNFLNEKEEAITKTAWIAFSYFSSNSKIAEFLEKEVLLKRNEAFSLQEIIQENEVIKKEIQKGLSFRISLFSKEKPLRALRLMSFLAETGEDVSLKLYELWQNCKENSSKRDLVISEIENSFPFLWEFLLERDLDLTSFLSENHLMIFSRLREKRLVQMAERLESLIQKDLKGIKESVKTLLKDASSKEKSFFAEKCILLNPSEHSQIVGELFALSMESLADLKELVQKAPLEKIAALLVRTNQMTANRAEELLEEVEKNLEFASFNEMIELWFFIANTKQNLLLYNADVNKIERKCFVMILAHMKETLSSPQALNLVKGYLLNGATPIEKAQISYQCCLLPSTYYTKASELFRTSANPFYEIKKQLSQEPWSNEALRNGFNFMQAFKGELGSYTELALDKIRDYPISLIQEMRPFFQEAAQKIWIAQTILEAQKILLEEKKEKVEPFLAFLMHSEVASVLLQDSEVYSEFLKIVDLYLFSLDSSSKKNQVLLKLGKFTQVQGERLEADLLLQLKIAFFLINASVLSKKEEIDEVIVKSQKLEDSSLMVLSSKIGDFSWKAKAPFIYVLNDRLKKAVDLESVLNALCVQLISICKASISKEEMDHLNIWVLVQSLIFLRGASSSSLSKCARVLCIIAVKTSKQACLALLISEIHCFRIEQAIKSYKEIGSSSIDSRLDLFAYLEFLESRKISAGEIFFKDEDLYSLIARSADQSIDSFSKYFRSLIPKIKNICQVRSQSDLDGNLAVFGLRLIYDLKSPTEFRETINALLNFILNVPSEKMPFDSFLKVYRKMREEEDYNESLYETKVAVAQELQKYCSKIEIVQTEQEFEDLYFVTRILFESYLEICALSASQLLRIKIFDFARKIDSYKRESFLSFLNSTLTPFNCLLEEINVGKLAGEISFLSGLLDQLEEPLKEEFQEKIGRFLELFLEIIRREGEGQFPFDQWNSLGKVMSKVSHPMAEIALREIRHYEFLGSIKIIRDLELDSQFMKEGRFLTVQDPLICLSQNVGIFGHQEEIEAALSRVLLFFVEESKSRPVFFESQLLRSILQKCKTPNADLLINKLILKIQAPYINEVLSIDIPALLKVTNSRFSQIDITKSFCSYCFYLGAALSDSLPRVPVFLEISHLDFLVSLFKQKNAVQEESMKELLFTMIVKGCKECSIQNYQTFAHALFGVKLILEQEVRMETLEEASWLIQFAAECPWEEEPKQCVSFLGVYNLFKFRLEAENLTLFIQSSQFECSLLEKASRICLNKRELEQEDFEVIFYLLNHFCFSDQVWDVSQEDLLNCYLVGLLRRVSEQEIVLNKWIQDSEDQSIQFPFPLKKLIEKVSKVDVELSQSLQIRLDLLKERSLNLSEK